MKSKKSSSEVKKFVQRYEEAIKTGELAYDDEGKIIPSPEDFRCIEKECPDKTAAEKYQLAQAQALLRIWETK